MNTIKRGVRNIVRNPVRLALAVVLLGVSLLFVVAMLGLNESAQARLNELNDQVGTSITILPPGGALSQQQFDLVVHTLGVINYAGESIADCHSTDPHFQLISPFPPLGGNMYGLTVYTSNHTHIPEMLAMLHQELGDGFQFSTMQGQFDASIQSLDAIQQTSLLTLLAALTAAILVIVFTVFLLVRERRREIGILRAVGASIWQVVGQFAIEILSSSLIAALLAALLLLPVGPVVAGATVIAPPINHGASVSNSAALLASAQPLTITLTMQSVLALLLASLLLAIVASFIPAWYVSRLRPAHALRTK